MIHYRLYTLGADNGPIIASEDFSAADDVAAVRSVKVHAAGRPMELWCGTRKVKSFPAQEQALA